MADVRRLSGARDPVADLVREADAALKRPADQGQVEVVDEELFGAQPVGPAVAEALRKGVGILSVEVDLRPSPDHVVIEGEARRADGAQHGVAQALAIVELARIRRLEQ
ncbi:hypothetical protein D3C86_1081120 [compost metagenome]